ncbi:MAG TPA: PIN domain-containing protein [Pirellulales bacterium]
MSEVVADASAVLAFALGENGERKVAKVREQCIVATPNLLEAVSKLLRANFPADRVQIFLKQFFPRVAHLDRDLAEASGALHATTRGHGLSYADCVCLMLGMQLKATVLTADRRWEKVGLDVKLELIR